MPFSTGNFKIEVNIPRRASCFKTQSKEKTQHKITTTLVYALAISVFLRCWIIFSQTLIPLGSTRTTHMSLKKPEKTILHLVVVVHVVCV